MLTPQEFLNEWNNGSTRLLVHTSGSTGMPKPLWVEKRRMEASARITCDFLGLLPGDTALLCMPLDFIAGKMMVVRSLVRGLRLLTVEPGGHPLALTPRLQTLHPPFRSRHCASDTQIDFAAMVPLQVWNSLQVPEERERLRRIRHLLIGGGAVDDALASELHDFPNAVWSTYGMTETLSHIALRRLSGPDASLWYKPFTGVGLSLSDEQCLVIDAPAVCPEKLTTNDIAELATDGRFRILGRRDNIICSGGLKIQAEEAERMLKPFIPTPFLISKRHDTRLGEAVVLLYQQTDGLTADGLRNICARHLPRYWMPRAFVPVVAIPLTKTGKPARKEAEQLSASDS